MEKSKTSNRYSPEVRARAVRMVLEHQGSYETQAAAIVAIAPKIGCIAETLRLWVRQAEQDSGSRDGISSGERERIKELEREVRQLRQANEILRKASALFCSGGTRPPVQTMISFIDDQRTVYGVELICRVLPIAPSTYYHQLACRADPTKLSPRCQRDISLKPKIQKVWDDNWKVYGVRKTWRQLRREGVDVARCTVARLMAGMGLRGIVRGKSLKTTFSDISMPCPRDKVNRQFRASAPDILWVSDFTYVSTWQGFTYVAFIIDTFANRIVGWKVSRSAKTDFVLDALEQALYARRPDRSGKLTHHSDRGSQYVSIDTLNGWPKRALSHRLAAWAMPMTMLWLKQSTAFIKPKSSAGAARGKPWRR